MGYLLMATLYKYLIRVMPKLIITCSIKIKSLRGGAMN
jgi:hypothetical protein